MASDALGLVPHTGWAWLVRVRPEADGAASVIARERVVACEVTTGEVYHLAAERTRDREGFLAARRAAALRQAGAALGVHVAGARTAMVLGKISTLPPLERIVAAHPRIHAAEGELWRALFAEACADHGLKVSRRDATALRTDLERWYGARAVAEFLGAGRRAVGSPWSREPQDAALAAWSALLPGLTSSSHPA